MYLGASPCLILNTWQSDMCCTLKLTGSQPKLAKCSVSRCDRCSRSRTNLTNLFCVTWSLFFQKLVKLLYQNEHPKSKWHWIRAEIRSLRVCCERNLRFLNKNFNLAFAFFMTDLAMDSPDNCWSNVAPRYFTEDVDWILVPLQETLKEDLDFNLGLDPKRIVSV